MKKLLYIVLLTPLVLTGATFAWVLKQERKLLLSQSAALPLHGEPLATDDPLVKQGQELFNAKGCVYCHGPNGAGGVKNPNSQGGVMPSLTSVAYGFSTQELKTKILAGVREIDKLDPTGPAPPLYMPSWKGHVTDEELSALAAFLISLAPKQEAGADDF